MCHRPLFIAFILLSSICMHHIESVSNLTNLPNILINCTVDDLRNINQQYKNHSTSLPVDYKFLYCDVVAIPDDFFADVSSLQSLEFCSSKVISIRSNALGGLWNLEILRIVDNPNLTQLNAWSAHNLSKLIELNLHENGIKLLANGALDRYPNLKHLNLQRNAINDIPTNFLGTAFNLETLNLAENRLHRIESDTFKALLQLTDLNLAYNRIDHIDEHAFTTTIRLNVLRLNGNQIKTVNSMVFFNLAQLEYLNLSENALNAYAIEKDAFKQNTRLQHLDVSHNSMFTIVSNALRGLNSLQILNLNNNHLTSVALTDLVNLKNLDMSFNKLTHLLDNQFSLMRSLETLNISYNRLNSIQPFTFTDLISLQTLDLSSNRLHTDAFLDSAGPINAVDLRHNAYEQIDLSALNSIGQIFLGNNPWNCTWLLNAMANFEHVVADIRFGFEFSDGIQSQNQTKSSSTIEELDCVDYRKSIEYPSVRRVFIINFSQCNKQKNLRNVQKKGPIFTYPRTFSKLLSDEFDYKACLLWTVVAVCLVIGLVRLGKYCLNESEKKSERYRMVQQEKVLKDIDEYFAQNSRRRQRS